jgi:hypothetical protein
LAKIPAANHHQTLRLSNPSEALANNIITNCQICIAIDRAMWHREIKELYLLVKVEDGRERLFLCEVTRST